MLTPALVAATLNARPASPLLRLVSHIVAVQIRDSRAVTVRTATTVVASVKRTSM